MAGNANSGSKRDKVWRDALMIAAKRTVEETQTLVNDPNAPVIAKAAGHLFLVAIGEKPDVSAIKEIGDRLDGKAKQQVEVGGEDGGGIVFSIGRHAAKD